MKEVYWTLVAAQAWYLMCLLYPIFLVRSYVALDWYPKMKNKYFDQAMSEVRNKAVLSLRNRKHFLCFYTIVETRKGKPVGRVFPRNFEFSQNFHECFYNVYTIIYIIYDKISVRAVTTNTLIGFSACFINQYRHVLWYFRGFNLLFWPNFK